jgi:hypothetical protein
MATKDMSREEAAALYERKVRDLKPDKVIEARLDEYRRDAEERRSHR